MFKLVGLAMAVAGIYGGKRQQPGTQSETTRQQKAKNERDQEGEKEEREKEAITQQANDLFAFR